jgi:hypothetical protein
VTELSLSNIGMDESYKPKYFLGIFFIIDNSRSQFDLEQMYLNKIR